MNEMRQWAVVFAVMLAGCGTEVQTRPLREYRIKLTRPDGALHSTYAIKSDKEPDVTATEAGCLRVWSWSGFTVYRSQPYPVGWLVEVEPIEVNNE